MGKGADVYQSYEDSQHWGFGDVENGKMSDLAAEIKALDHEEFEEFYGKLDEGDRGELRETMEQTNLDVDPEYREIYDALEGDGNAQRYSDKLRQEFSGGQYAEAQVSEGEYMEGGLIRLYIPKGASPFLQGVIEDTQNEMQASINTLGTGDKDGRMGFTEEFDGNISSGEGWSRITGGHTSLLDDLNDRKERFVEKNKEVEVDTYEAEATEHDLFDALIAVKDDLNDDHLKRDLSELGGYDWEIGEGESLKYIVVDADAVSGDVEDSPLEVHDYATGELLNTSLSSDGEKVDPGYVRIYEMNSKNEGEEEGNGYQEGVLYLTPEAEWHFYLHHIEEHMGQWDEAYEEGSSYFDGKAANVDDDNADNDDNGQEGTYQDGYEAGLADGQEQGGENGTDTTGTGTDTETGNEDFSSTFEDLLGPEDSETAEDGTSGLGDDTSGEGEGNSPLDEVLQPIRDAITGGGAGGAGAAGADSGMGMMMPMMMANMIPQLMQQFQQRDQEDERAERASERPEDPQGAPAPGPGATAPAPQPGATQAPAPSGAQPGPESEAPPNSMVDMQLPDGTTQQVSSAVSEAVNRELNNPNGSDARAAYQGTAGEASAGSPWVSVDSSAVATGDVAQWENRSALVVVTDSGLQGVVNGELVPLDPHNPPDGGQGGYGEFRGFFHPSGADVSGGEGQDQPAPAPADPPAVSAAQPEAAVEPPAVSPPEASMEVR